MAEIQSISKRWLVVTRVEAKLALQLPKKADDIDILEAFKELSPCFHNCKLDNLPTDPAHVLRIELHGSDPLIMPALWSRFHFEPEDGDE